MAELLSLSLSLAVALSPALTTTGKLSPSEEHTFITMRQNTAFPHISRQKFTESISCMPGIVSRAKCRTHDQFYQKLTYLCNNPVENIIFSIRIVF